MHKFKENDVVEIVLGSRYERQGMNHGEKMLGEVLSIIGSHGLKYRVQWSNGDTNSYSDEDLQLVTNDPFKVGDIIIGNSKNSYAHTSKGVTCEVVGIKGENMIQVVIVGSPEKYIVLPENFDLVEKSDKKVFFANTKVWIGGDLAISEKVQKEAFKQGWSWSPGSTELIREPINFFHFKLRGSQKLMVKGYLGNTEMEGFMECPAPTMKPSHFKSIVGEVVKEETVDPTYESLVKEAKERYIEGSRLSNYILGYDCTFKLIKHEYKLQTNGELMLQNHGIGGGNYTIYSNGKWAEILALPEVEKKPEKVLEFNVGDFVKIKETSTFHNQGIGKDGVFFKGEITSVDIKANFSYSVIWDKGGSNVYRKEDLEFYDPDSTVSEGYLTKESGVWLGEVETKEEDVIFSTDFAKPKVKVKKQIVGLEFQHPVIVRKKKTGTKKLITI